MKSFQIAIDGENYELAPDESLQELSEREDTGIEFGCFSGRCGFCRVRVLEGAGNLSERNSLEDGLLESIDAPEDERLACQCQPSGSVRLSTDVS